MSASERFMRHYYGASGYTDTSVVPEAICLAVVEYCKEHNLDYTAGTMYQMAKFAWLMMEGEPRAQLS